MDSNQNRNDHASNPSGPSDNLNEDCGPLGQRPDGEMPTGPDWRLRRKAETLARSREAEQTDPRPGHEGSESSVLHELVVHQIELELQNEELRATQAQLEAARARYFELYDLAPVGYMVLSDNGLILEANITAASILGIEKRALLNQPFTRFIVEEDQDMYYLRNRRLFRTLDPQVFDLRVNRDDHQVRWIQLTETIAKSTREDMNRRMVISDITDRKIAEDMMLQAEARAMDLVGKLQWADQNKNKFLNTLSHELRNPLAAITMSLSLQEMVPPGSEAAIRAGEVLKRQTAQLTHLIDDLLDITRISQNKLALKKKPVDLVELARRVVTDFQPSFAAKGVELVTRWPDAPIRLEADSVRMIQTIGNLLNNALKYTDTGGKVVVTLDVVRNTNSQPEAILQVTDNGMGMTRELQQKLFQPFVQADFSLDRSMGGLGLGLSVVKGMIEMHGGHVEAASEGLGMGSQFTIHLPLGSNEPADQPVKPVVKKDMFRPLRILIIEDNADLLQIMTELLAILGHEAATASTGTDGISCAASYHPDVVICDIGLPGLNGYEVARNLSQCSDHKRPFLIAMSGYGLPEDVARSKAAGFDQHISKPVDLAVLKQMLSNPEVMSRCEQSASAFHE